jgi:hypothetical protein
MIDRKMYIFLKFAFSRYISLSKKGAGVGKENISNDFVEFLDPGLPKGMFLANLFCLLVLV